DHPARLADDGGHRDQHAEDGRAEEADERARAEIPAPVFPPDGVQGELQREVREREAQTRRKELRGAIRGKQTFDDRHRRVLRQQRPCGQEGDPATSPSGPLRKRRIAPKSETAAITTRSRTTGYLPLSRAAWSFS